MGAGLLSQQTALANQPTRNFAAILSRHLSSSVVVKRRARVITAHAQSKPGIPRWITSHLAIASKEGADRVQNQHCNGRAVPASPQCDFREKYAERRRDYWVALAVHALQGASAARVPLWSRRHKSTRGSPARSAYHAQSLRGSGNSSEHDHAGERVSSEATHPPESLPGPRATRLPEVCGVSSLTSQSSRPIRMRHYERCSRRRSRHTKSAGGGF